MVKMEVTAEKKIIFSHHGPKKVNVIKLIRELHGYSIKEEKSWSEQTIEYRSVYELTRKEAHALFAEGPRLNSRTETG